ncbi:MAG: hypothetical protein EOM28_07080 [Clostridia bacterium]|nr:hypothetical protein [Clostridia bacterium]
MSNELIVAILCFMLGVVGVLNRLSYNMKKKNVGVTESESKSSAMFLCVTVLAFVGGIVLLVLGLL